MLRAQNSRAEGRRAALCPIPDRLCSRADTAAPVQAEGAKVANISRLDSIMPTVKVKDSSFAIVLLLEKIP
jgi:hypothetical protein